MRLIVWAGSLVIRLRSSERGASIVEYALLVTLIAVVAIVAVITFGTSLSGEYSDIAQSIP